MDVEQPVIDATLVRRMVATQFPRWADAAGLAETNAAEAARPWRVIDEVLEERSIDA
jgi:hypothetical protein